MEHSCRRLIGEITNLRRKKAKISFQSWKWKRCLFDNVYFFPYYWWVFYTQFIWLTTYNGFRVRGNHCKITWFRVDENEISKSMFHFKMSCSVSALRVNFILLCKAKLLYLAKFFLQLLVVHSWPLHTWMVNTIFTQWINEIAVYWPAVYIYNNYLCTKITSALHLPVHRKAKWS